MSLKCGLCASRVCNVANIHFTRILVRSNPYRRPHRPVLLFVVSVHGRHGHVAAAEVERAQHLGGGTYPRLYDNPDGGWCPAVYAYQRAKASTMECLYSKPRNAVQP